MKPPFRVGLALTVGLLFSDEAVRGFTPGHHFSPLRRPNKKHDNGRRIADEVFSSLHKADRVWMGVISDDGVISVEESKHTETITTCTSLASSFLVSVKSSDTTESWSLRSLQEVAGVSDDMAEGTLAMAALQSSEYPGEATLELECQIQPDQDDVISVTRKGEPTEGQEDESLLVSVLSRILVQRLIQRLEVSSSSGTREIQFPGESTPVVLDCDLSDSAIKSLFESVTDLSAGVELVDMVGNNGVPLGVVPSSLGPPIESASSGYRSGGNRGVTHCGTPHYQFSTHVCTPSNRHETHLSVSL